MSDYRFEFVKRNELDCLHVMIDSNSLQEIANTHIPLDDILEAAVAQGFMTHGITIEELDRVDECLDMLFTSINLVMPKEVLIGSVGLASQMHIKERAKEDYRALSDAIAALRKHSKE